MWPKFVESTEGEREDGEEGINLGLLIVTRFYCRFPRYQLCVGARTDSGSAIRLLNFFRNSVSSVSLW